MSKVTPSEVKQAALSAGIVNVPHMKCADCGAQWSYKIEDGGLLKHHVPCACVPSRKAGKRPAPWAEVAASINARPEGPQRVEMMRRWGFKIPNSEGSK